MSVAKTEPGAKDQWVIEMVEEGAVGEYASHILDSADHPHILYFDHFHGNLRHAEHGPDGWSIETVDREGTVGQYLSTALDKAGRLYVSYRDHGKNRLKLAIFDGRAWHLEEVDNEPFASLDTSISVDDEGRIHISYYNFSQGYLKLAVKENDRWIIEIIDGGQRNSNAVGGFSCLKVDARGRVHISYIDSANGLLKYAVKENGAWSIEIADDSEFVGNFTSLALDRDENPYISYTVDESPNKPDLWLARKAGGRWTNEMVDTQRVAGNYSSIVVDEHLDVYISYSAMTQLKLARNTRGAWSFEIIDSKGTITYTSLALDSRGIPHVAYHDRDRGVKFAHRVTAF